MLTTPRSNPGVQAMLRDGTFREEDVVEGISVVTEKGDVAVNLAIHWECAWMDAYRSAFEAGNIAEMKRATSLLEQFSSLPVIKRYNPEIGRGHDSEVLPRVREGNIRFVEEWLETGCAGVLK